MHQPIMATKSTANETCSQGETNEDSQQANSSSIVQLKALLIIKI